MQTGGNVKIRLYQVWATRLGTSEPSARQVSRGGGDFGCPLQGEIKLTP